MNQKEKDMAVSNVMDMLGLEETRANRAAVRFAFDTAVEQVLAYCGIDSIPDGLRSTVCRIAMGAYRESAPGISGVPVFESSVSEGDTSVSFQRASKSDGFSETLLLPYHGVLNRYRKVRWH